MEKLIIQGGNRLKGRVRVSSAKNAVLPIIAATMLGTTPSTLLEIPNLEDVGTICKVIESLGVKVTFKKEKDEIIFDGASFVLDKKGEKKLYGNDTIVLENNLHYALIYGTMSAYKPKRC